MSTRLAWLRGAGFRSSPPAPLQPPKPGANRHAGRAGWRGESEIDAWVPWDPRPDLSPPSPTCAPGTFIHAGLSGWRGIGGEDRTGRSLLGVLTLVTLLTLAGCRGNPPDSGVPARSQPPPPPGVFKDVAAAAGVNFTHTNGKAENYLTLQTLGGGCAIFDYDGDGWQDLLLVSCGDFPRTQPARNLALYRNLTGAPPPGTGGHPAALRFQEVTPSSGLDVDCHYAQGVAVADYDTDGRSDVFVSGYGGCRLFRNESPPDRPLFRDVTATAGVADQEAGARWATSAAWADYDHDGRLDLYLCHYAVWSPETDRRCPLPGGGFDLCSPTVYDGEPDRLFRNEGDGRFRDVSQSAGIRRNRTRGLAVAWTDCNDDGWDDVYVANDMDPNLLLRNDGDGTFTNVAEAAGVAYGAEGHALAGMGVAAGDYDGSGRESLFVTNLNDQLYSLFQHEGVYQGEPQFSYATERAGLRLATIPYSGFGCSFLDYDLDGWLDLVAGNGHVNPYVERIVPGTRYEMPRGLYQNVQGRFRDATVESGALQLPRSTRGLAVGDLDRDGRPEVVCVNRNAPVEIFHNQAESPGSWLSLRLAGTESNRDGAGAKARVTVGGRRLHAYARRGCSYGSTNAAPLLFGLGDAREVSEVEIRWPGGRREIHRNVPLNRELICTEGRGYVVAD